MSVLNKPNFLSGLILLVILLIALTYGYCTYQVAPDRTIFISGNEAGQELELPYDLDRPNRIIYLPDELVEISGLALGLQDELYCIQDEDGKLFVFNLASERIVSEHKFGKDRDYEGIARVGDTIYVLERDGDLHFFSFAERQDEYEAEKLETGFSYRNDTEGLCYDADNNRLLIAPKEQNLVARPESSHLKHIYAYEPGSQAIIPDPVFQIDEYELGQLVYGQRQRYTFKPSAIALHPQTGHLYFLSAVGESLLVMDRTGELVFLKRLDRSIFPQPEGLAFDRYGRLIISTEGQGAQALLAIFDTRQNGQTAPADSTSTTE